MAFLGLSPHHMDKILDDGIQKGLTDRQYDRINATMDEWQILIKASNRCKVVEKYMRILHAVMDRLHTISIIHGDEYPTQASKRAAILSHLDLGFHIKELNSLVVAYSEEDMHGPACYCDDCNDNDCYDDYCGICLSSYCDGDCWP